MNHKVSIGERLREERKQTALSQRAFAARVGVTEKTQVLYEKGERVPDALYLMRMYDEGVDVLYVVTGERQAAKITGDEAGLIARYRDAPIAVRTAALAALTAGAAPAKYEQNFDGATIGQQVSGDVTGPFTIELGTKKRKSRDTSK